MTKLVDIVDLGKQPQKHRISGNNTFYSKSVKNTHEKEIILIDCCCEQDFLLNF